MVIGRNEGERLIRCLQSLAGQAAPLVYVDSGSTDGSAEAAEALGAVVVQLDLNRPFTAARARNAGLLAARVLGARDFVQFVDGDCEVLPGWIGTGLDALQDDPQLAAVAGRRIERHPGASVFNLICDIEWDTPVGPAQAVGGDMLARIAALEEVGGFREDLIAGEEPELCLRLRRSGWRIARLDAPMTLHDAAMHRLRQWSRRTRRAGHAFAEVSWLHRHDPEGFWHRETRRAVVWGALLPAAVVAAGLLHPAAWALFLAWPAQAARLALRDRSGCPARVRRAALTVLGKFVEAQGVLEFHLRRLLRRRAGIIEYK